MIVNLKNKWIPITISLTVIGVIVGCYLKTTQTFSNVKQYTIVLDAGHGEPDGGAVGVNGTIEQSINLKITQKLQEILENRGIKVIMTRSDNNSIYDESAKTLHDMKISDMHKRLDIINNSNADLFLSIHLNSFSKPTSSGLHIFYSRNHPEIKPLAESIQEEIAKLTGAKAHTVKAASDTLYLMKSPTPPSILIECGFISNPDEEKLLNNDTYQSKIAFSIANAVCKEIDMDFLKK